MYTRDEVEEALEQYHAAIEADSIAREACYRAEWLIANLHLKEAFSFGLDMNRVRCEGINENPSLYDDSRLTASRKEQAHATLLVRAGVFEKQ